MRHRLTLRLGLLVLSVGMASLPAWADDDCSAPLELWQSREAVRQLAAAKGWQVHRLKIDDGCYEVRATDAEGRAFKAKLDPETLKVLTIKHRDRDRDRDHERYRARDRDHVGDAPRSGSPAPEAASAASGPSPVPRSDTAPR